MKRALLGVTVCASVGACTIMNGYELPAPTAITTGDAGTRRGPDGGVTTTAPDGAAACTPKHPPAKPAATTGGTDTTIIVALESMLANNNGAPLGYDLDGLCTCPDSPPCTTTGQPQCDANGDGTDNAGANLSKGLNNVFNPIVLSNQRIENGQYGLIVRVDGYNQQPNDDAVQVTITRSVGIDGGPNFTALQAWPGSTHTTMATTAWVAGSSLVANFDAIDVPFLDDTPKPAQMRRAMLVAPITGTTMQSALLVGRAPTNELVASVGELEVFQGTPESAVCQQSQFTSFGSSTCALQDINADPTNAGATRCDALSLTVSFTLIPATIGSNQAIPPVDERCDGVTPIQCK